MKEGFFIGELSRKVGISQHTIRYYGRLGLINPPNRSETRYRVYSEEDEARLRFIQHAKIFGLSLEEIKEIIGIRAEGVTPCERLKEMIKRHLNELDCRIQEMIAFRDESALRYERLKSVSDVPTGTIRGLIERESSSVKVPDN